MTTITIPLQQGINYISFPATSTSDFLSIFTNSTMLNNITVGGFNRFDPISQQLQTVPYTEYIAMGMGYNISVSTQSAIVYEGTEYALQFSDLESLLVQGWNLIGTGNNVISLPNWCDVRVPSTNSPVTRLLPKFAYWVNYDYCQQPVINPMLAIFGAGLMISILSLWISLRKSKTQNIDT